MPRQVAPRTVLWLPSPPPAPRHTAPAFARPLVRHIISCKIMPWEPRHDVASPLYSQIHQSRTITQVLQHPPPRSLLLVCLRLGLLLTATNAQSSQIISFNVNTKTASSRSSSGCSSESGSGSGLAQALALAVAVVVALAASLPSPSTSSATAAASWRALKAESLTLQFSMARWANKLSGSDGKQVEGNFE